MAPQSLRLSPCTWNHFSLLHFFCPCFAKLRVGMNASTQRWEMKENFASRRPESMPVTARTSSAWAFAPNVYPWSSTSKDNWFGASSLWAPRRFTFEANQTKPTTGCADHQLANSLKFDASGLSLWQDLHGLWQSITKVSDGINSRRCCSNLNQFFSKSNNPHFKTRFVQLRHIQFEYFGQLPSF